MYNENHSLKDDMKLTLKWFELALLPTLVLILWALAAMWGTVSPILLPAPSAVIDSACGLIASGQLWHHIVSSAKRTLSGFALAAVFGILLAFLFSQSARAKNLGYILIEAMRVTPPLALIPLLILWLGIEEAPKIAIVFLSSFFPIYLDALTAIESIEHKLKEVAKILQFSRWEMFRLLTVPAALPGILTGLRVGFGYSWRALVGAELIAASTGLGFMIGEAGEFSKTSVVFVGILTIVVIGVLADLLLSFLIKRFAKYFAM